MSRSRIDGIDIHLLRTLYMLLTEGGVSKAALRLNQSQPAVSNALRRLRELTGDPLLVRVKSSMLPTEYALQLIQPTARALADLEHVFQSKSEFRPSANEEFCIAAPDGLDPQLIPRLVGLSQAGGEAVRLKFVPLDPGNECVSRLESADMDLVITPWVEPPPHLHAAPLWDDRLVLLMRAGHPLARQELSAETYRRARHVALRIRLNGQPSAVDQLLALAGLDRDVWVTVSIFGLVPSVLVSTDLVFVCASRFARACSATYPLVVRELPQRIPRFRVNQLWHSRKHHSPRHLWLRERVLEVAQKLSRNEPSLISQELRMEISINDRVIGLSE